MSSVHSFQGKCIALTGRFTQSRETFVTELEASGARTTKSVSPKTDYLIMGIQTGGSLLTRARQVGAFVLTEAQARAVMAGEPIEVSHPGEGGEQSIDELLGEARSLLAQPPSANTWRALLMLFDQCEQAHHPALTEYIRAHTSTWSAAQMQEHHGREITEEDLDAELGYWEKNVLEQQSMQRHAIYRGELRVAPQSWNAELLKQLDSPKYSLAHAISLSSSSRTLIGALAHPHLTHVERLHIHATPQPTLQLGKALCESDMLPRLRYLSLGSMSLKTIEHMVAHTSPAQLSCLDISFMEIHDYLSVTAIYKGLCDVPMLQTIDTLRIRHVDQYTQMMLSHVSKEGLFPDLRALHIDNQGRLPGSDLHKLLETKILDRVDTLGIGRVNLSTYNLEHYWGRLFCKSIPPHITTLDMSLLDIDNGLTEAQFEQAVQIMSEGLLLRHITHVCLGDLLDEARLVTPLKAFLPHITFTR